MSAERGAGPDRISVQVDRATRIVRLLTWIAMFAACCLMLWLLAGQAAKAEDPKAAARSLGQAGQAAAGAIARDATMAADVPGYAGTNLPERRLTAVGHGGRRARCAWPSRTHRAAMPGAR